MRYELSPSQSGRKPFHPSVIQQHRYDPTEPPQTEIERYYYNVPCPTALELFRGPLGGAEDNASLQTVSRKESYILGNF